MSKFCTNCGVELDDDAMFCTNCGAAQGEPAQAVDQAAQTVEQAAQPVAPQYQAPAAPQYPPQYQQPAAAAPVAAGSGTGVLVMGIIALSLACLSIIFCWAPFFNIIFAIPAIILGAIAKSKGGKLIRSGAINGKIKTGRILGLVGMILGIVFVVVGVILTIVIIAAGVNYSSSYYRYFY